MAEPTICATNHSSRSSSWARSAGHRPPGMGEARHGRALHKPEEGPALQALPPRHPCHNDCVVHARIQPRILSGLSGNSVARTPSEASAWLTALASALSRSFRQARWAGVARHHRAAAAEGADAERWR
jgi:hypothetical protein